MSLEKILDAVGKHRRFHITTHRNPEADAIGSSLALAHLLCQAGKEALVICRDPIPTNIRFLPHDNLFLQVEALPGDVEVLFVLDCGDAQRTGLLDAAGGGAPSRCLVINIDHHVTNRNFGSLNWVDPAAAATGELIFELMRAMGRSPSPELALCVYATLVSETGFFSYSNTRAKTLRLAAELLDYKVDPWTVAQRLRENTPERLNLLSELLRGMERSPDGSIAWMTATREVFKRTHTTGEDLEEMIGYPRSLKGVEIAILFTEADDANCKVSMRSKNFADVAAIAGRFGGGGHTKAAGCTVAGSLSEVRTKIVAAAEEAVKTGV